MTEPNKTELVELFDQYIDECRYIKQLRKATLKSYAEVFQNFQKYIPAIKKVEDLHPNSVVAFFAQLGRRSLKASTLRSYYDKLIAFFRWLERKGHDEAGILVRGIVKPPHPHYEDSKELNPEEISAIQSAIALRNQNDAFQYRRDITILSLFLYTGIRKGELLGLKIKDVDFHQRTIYVQAASSKSKRGRYVPINPSLLIHLKNYFESLRKKGIRSDQLIISVRTGNAFTEHGLKHWVKRYNDLSGVSFHVHQFRHTFACRLGRAHADISSIRSLLGHSSISMTERYLRSIAPVQSRSILDAIHF